MRTILLLSILLIVVNAYSSEECPNEQAFKKNGWIIHDANDFQHILAEKLHECRGEIGKDLILDDAESYLSDFSYDYYLLMWIVILDRISTVKDEMWGDISFSKTGPYTGEYTEVRWYDPATKKKHIVYNPKHSFCLTTKVPLAYNTIF